MPALPRVKLASLQSGGEQIEYDDGEDHTPGTTSMSYMERDIALRNVCLESPTLHRAKNRSREQLRETAYLGSVKDSTMQMLAPMQARMEITSQNDTSTQHEELLNSQRDR